MRTFRETPVESYVKSALWVLAWGTIGGLQAGSIFANPTDATLRDWGVVAFAFGIAVIEMVIHAKLVSVRSSSGGPDAS